MLIINTRNDKLAAARIDFTSHGMLDGTCLSETLDRLQDTPEHTNNSDSECSSEDGQDLDSDEDENRTGPVDGPPTLSEVTLAQKRGEYHSFFHI